MFTYGCNETRHVHAMYMTLHVCLSFQLHLQAYIGSCFKRNERYGSRDVLAWMFLFLCLCLLPRVQASSLHQILPQFSMWKCCVLLGVNPSRWPLTHKANCLFSFFGIKVRFTIIPWVNVKFCQYPINFVDSWT